MKKLKNITAAEALRLMRLGFSDSEIIEADSKVSESAYNVKEKKQSTKKEKKRQKEIIEDNTEDITAKEILQKIEEIKNKHSYAVKNVENFLSKSKEEKVDKLLDKKEIEIKQTYTISDVEDISSE
jgi:hypothetical protein